MPINLENIKKFKKSMSLEQKRRLLKSLKTVKEEYTGNIGGETDIANSDNLQVNEDEFTAADKPSRNVVAKKFDTQGDFDSYVNQRRGIEMTEKEQQAILTEDTQPEQNDITVNDPIRITKSITFIEDTDGADVLADLIEALSLQKSKPTQQDKFFIKYEVSDDLGNNTTTVIKKLKEGNQFCWTAFSKYQSAGEEGKPEGSEESEENGEEDTDKTSGKE